MSSFLSNTDCGVDINKFFDAPYDVLTNLASAGVALERLEDSAACDQESWSGILLAELLGEMDIEDTEGLSAVLHDLYNGEEHICGRFLEIVSNRGHITYLERTRAITPVLFQDPDVWTVSGVDWRNACIIDRVIGGNTARATAFGKFPQVSGGNSNIGMLLGTAMMDSWQDLFILLHGYSSKNPNPPVTSSPLIDMSDFQTRTILSETVQKGMLINSTGDIAIRSNSQFELYGHAKHPVHFAAVEAPMLHLLTDYVYKQYHSENNRLTRIDLQTIFASATQQSVRATPVVVTRGTPLVFVSTPNATGSNGKASHGVENPQFKKLPSTVFQWTGTTGSAVYKLQNSKTQPFAFLRVEMTLKQRSLCSGENPSLPRKMDVSKPASLQLHNIILSTPHSGVYTVYPVYEIVVACYHAHTVDSRGELLYTSTQTCITSLPVIVRVLDPHTDLQRVANQLKDATETEWTAVPPAMYPRKTQQELLGSITQHTPFTPPSHISMDAYIKHLTNLVIYTLEKSISLSTSANSLLNALSSASGNAESGVDMLQQSSKKTLEKLKNQSSPSIDLVSMGMNKALQLQQQCRLTGDPAQLQMVDKMVNISMLYMHLGSLCSYIPLLAYIAVLQPQVIHTHGYNAQNIQANIQLIDTYLSGIAIQHPALLHIALPNISMNMEEVAVLPNTLAGIHGDVAQLVKMQECNMSLKKVLDTIMHKEGLFGAIKETMYHNDVLTLGQVVVKARRDGGITGILLSNSPLKKVLHSESDIITVTHGILSCLYNGVGYVASPEQVLVGLVEQTRAVAPLARLVNDIQPIIAPKDQCYDGKKWLDGHLNHPLTRQTRAKAAECRRAINKLKTLGHVLSLRVNSDLHEVCVLQRKHHEESWVSPELEKVWSHMQMDGTFFTLELWSTKDHVDTLLAADCCHAVMREVYVATRCTNDIFKSYQIGFILAFAAQSYLASLGYLSYDLGGADMGPMMKYKASLAIYEDGEVSAKRHGQNTQLGPISVQTDTEPTKLYKPFQNKHHVTVVASLMDI